MKHILFALSMFLMAAASFGQSPLSNITNIRVADQARAHDQKTNKVDTFFTHGAYLWDNILTGPQKQAIRDVINAANVSTNLPGQ